MNKIIVIGGGGHARVVISILKKLKKYDIIGYTDIKNKDEILGVSYLGDDKSFIETNKNIRLCAIGIGQIKNVETRRKIIHKYLNAGFEFPAIISPDSIVNEEIKIGDGTVVMDGVIINSGTQIGKYSILNTNSSIDHDCLIGNNSHIAPGVTMSGNVKTGDNILIGAGSTIIHGREIGSNTIIGAGSVVVKNFSDNVIAYGNPCKVIKNNK